MGVADGSIIPAIIAAHMAQSTIRRGASHTGVIIHAAAPVMAPYMSRAIAITHIQHANGTMTSTRTSVRRLFRKAVSTSVGLMADRRIPVTLPEIRRADGSRLDCGDEPVGTGNASAATVI